MTALETRTTTQVDDLVASLSIVLDKPFVIGDFLNVDGSLGKVEHIGRMYERRVVFTVGVAYPTRTIYHRDLEPLSAAPAPAAG